MNTPVVKGIPKSGRVWKGSKNTFSSMKSSTKPLTSSWSVKMQQKAEKQSIKKLEAELKLNKQQEKEARKQRTIEKRKRKEENTRKAEVVQVIRNTAKLKRMSKKKLRYIRKRDTL